MSMPWLDKPSRPGFWWLSTPEGLTVAQVWICGEGLSYYTLDDDGLYSVGEASDWKWQRLYEPATHPHAKVEAAT